MGSCQSKNPHFYSHNNTIYRNYCDVCNIHYSPNYTEEKHCCECKVNYHKTYHHCCYCQKSYPDWHICECKNCSLRSHKTINSNAQHTICKKCYEQCSYKHICECEKGECNICNKITYIKKLECCKETKDICRDCYQKIKKCCPFCTKDIVLQK